MQTDLLKARFPFVAVGAAGVAMIALFFTVSLPLASKIRQAELESEMLELKLACARRDFQKGGLLYVEKCLVPKKDISLIIDKITDIGRSRSIDFISISLMPFEKGAGCEMVPINMDVRATYEELGEFLESLRKAKRCMIKVNRIKVSPDKDAPGTLLASIECRLYMKPQNDGR